MVLLRIARHEYRYQLRSLQSLIVAGSFFALAFLFTANGIEFQTTARGGNVLVNSPYIIINFLALVSLITVFFIPAIIAGSVLKDVDNHFEPILFSTPVSKNAYLGGRFSGSFAALATTLLAAPLGLYLGTLWPLASPETLGPNYGWHYLAAYFSYLLPSVFISSLLIFAVAILTRSMLYSYLAALGMFMLYLAVVSSQNLPAVWDPFLLEVISEQTRYWTAAERNTQWLGYPDSVLTSRLLWFAIAAGIYILAYTRYALRHSAAPVKQHKRDKQHDTSGRPLIISENRGMPEWNAGTHWRQCLWRTRFEVMSIISSRPFILLMSFSFVLLMFALTGRETLYDVETYPLTRIMLDAIRAALTFALMAILAFYSADVIWRERSVRYSAIIDALPAPNWVFVVSKVAALTLVMYAIVLLGIIIAISIQLLNGHHDLQLGLYLGRGLFYYTMPYIFLAILTCFFQVLAKNRVVGMLLFGIFMTVLVMSRDIFGVDHILLSYALPGIPAPLSEMNPNDRFATAGYWARLYWGSVAGILLMLTYVLWNRGTLQPLKYRLRQLRMFRFRGFAMAAATFIGLFLGSGAYIFYNTNILNKHRSEFDVEQLQLAYEQQYRQYEDLPMPRIVAVSMDVDIDPYQRRVESRSSHVLENKTTEPINTVHLVFPIESEVHWVDLEGAVLQSVDEILNYYILVLEFPMLPGEQRTLTFATLIQQQGFTNGYPDIRLVRNGTFIGNHQLTPYIGFHQGLMISDRNTRRDYGLEPLPRMPGLDDQASRYHNTLRQDSDFIHFKTTVSTVSDQIAIAPGYLVDQWSEGARRYFTYEMDAPIMNFYSYLSADYQIARDQWGDVAIEIFHHHQHDYNIDRMIAGVKDSLDYYSTAFGPYQYRQVRIVEFPAYREFAQAFPNTIPFSEGIGFIADITDPNEMDLPYYVTAHEMAHQWWAHQVMSANVQGGTLLTETLAQYSALMVMEKKYGQHHIHRFLKLELDRYLSQRADDAEGELPLYKVENQPHIHYRKGAVIMYALKDYLGESVVNSALRQLLAAHAYQATPYPVSTDLIAYLKEAAGPEHYPMIEDFFEKITLYDLSMQHSAITRLDDGRFKVTLDLAAVKYYEDALGNQTTAVMNLPVDIGLFRKSPAAADFTEDDVILLDKHLVNPEKPTVEVIVDQWPLYAGIDPYHKLIDRDLENNIVQLSDEENTSQPSDLYLTVSNSPAPLRVNDND
ncbi:MAG: M1 family metallopeptidase [Wenzhouxiangellaceae bacterium]